MLTQSSSTYSLQFDKNSQYTRKLEKVHTKHHVVSHPLKTQFTNSWLNFTVQIHGKFHRPIANKNTQKNDHRAGETVIIVSSVS